MICGEKPEMSFFPHICFIKSLQEQYDGRLFHPELLWYGKKIKLAKEFDFSLQGNSSCMQITVPALRLAEENNTTISNIVVKFRKELPYMIFSAKTDLVQLLANHFKNKYFLPPT